ncbi:MAG: glycosyltransferase family 2 protein [Pseudonocardiaceae bacterium]
MTITVSFNSRPWLAECFATITASRARSASVEFVLVDNTSTDGSADLVTQRHPTVTLLTTVRNEGFAGANNLAIRYALARGADFVFLLNPDTRTPPDLLDSLVEFLDAGPSYGIVGPMQYRYTTDGIADGQLNDWSVTALQAGQSNIFDLDWPGLPSPAGPVIGRAPGTLEHAYVQGAALMCRAEVLRGVGLFDETYHSYYEESDLCRRARWGGWRVALHTDLGIQHFGGGSGNSRYRRRMMLRNKYYFLITDPEWRAQDIARLALRWLVRDLRRRGPAPAERTVMAMGDTLVGMLWLLRQGPRMAARRRAHRRLLHHGAGGPLAVNRGRKSA